MKIALIQTSLIWGSVEENLRLCADRVAGCNGCDLILLPEMFTFGSMMAKVPREVADVEKKEVAGRFSEVRQKMQEWAMQRHAVVAGSTVYEENAAHLLEKGMFIQIYHRMRLMCSRVVDFMESFLASISGKA